MAFNFQWTAHAIRRLEQRRLTKDVVENTVKYPDRKKRQRKGLHGGFVERFEKTIGLRKCVVVAEVKRCDIWVTTCFWTL